MLGRLFQNRKLQQFIPAIYLILRLNKLSIILEPTFLLPDFPAPQRIAVKVNRNAERAIRLGHPWVFEDSIVKVSKEPSSGDLAIIYDQRKNKFLAVGFFDLGSIIRIKILQHTESANINESWFVEKVSIAKSKREELLKTDTNSYRLLFGENDGLPGVICDIYNKVAVLKLYSAGWISQLKNLLPAIHQSSGAEIIVLRLSRNVGKETEAILDIYDGKILIGVLEDPVVSFKEHGLKFQAHVLEGHKTGYFLDHRHNRKRVGELAKGKRVLDIFSYAGGFTVHALMGGASEVISLDISRQAQELAKENVALNIDTDKHEVLVADAFVGMQNLIKAGEQFDLIICDPPSFAKSAKEIPQAMNSYERLAKLAVKLIRKEGILIMCSCSSRIKPDDFFAANEKIFRQGGRSFELVERTGHDSDHPIGFPEGEYLKSGYYQF